MEDSNSLMQQRKFEILLEMQAKRFESELSSLRQHIASLNGEIVSLKSQISRLQFSPQAINPPVPQGNSADMGLVNEPKRKVEIIDCRPENERKAEFIGGSSKNNAEPIRPRYGDYKSEDVSIDKFFYYGNKR